MANIITMTRVLLAFFILTIIKLSPAWNLVAIILIAVTMLLDAVDGSVARYLRISTANGSIYDILADRIIENVFFIYFATNGVCSVWITIVVVVRGLLIDAIRAIFSTKGKTAFGETTLHTRSWRVQLACSKISRGFYNSCKMLSFMLCAALLIKNNYIQHFINPNYLQRTAVWFLHITVLLCIIRAFPVVVELFTSQNMKSWQPQSE